MLTMARRPLGAEMEKPKNRWAIGLWIIASLFAVGQITEINLINCKPATSWHVRNLGDRAIPLCPRFYRNFRKPQRIDRNDRSNPMATSLIGGARQGC